MLNQLNEAIDNARQARRELSLILGCAIPSQARKSTYKLSEADEWIRPESRSEQPLPSLPPEDAYDLLDFCARRWLSVTGDEFIEAFAGGNMTIGEDARMKHLVWLYSKVVNDNGICDPV